MHEARKNTSRAVLAGLLLGLTSAGSAEQLGIAKLPPDAFLERPDAVEPPDPGAPQTNVAAAPAAAAPASARRDEPRQPDHRAVLLLLLRGLGGQLPYGSR
jgi:hypothetical protein